MLRKHSFPLRQNFQFFNRRLEFGLQILFSFFLIFHRLFHQANLLTDPGNLFRGLYVAGPNHRGAKERLSCIQQNRYRRTRIICYSRLSL